MTEDSKTKSTKKTSNLMVYVGDEKTEMATTFEKQIAMLNETTPEKYIQKKKGRGGLLLDYVEANYIIGRLNATFQYNWDTEIIDKIIGRETKQIAVLVRLKARFLNGQEVQKDAWGGSEIKCYKGNGEIVDLADDIKAAESDGIKKAASMLGIAWDVYAGLARQIHEEGEEKAEAEKKVDDPPAYPKNVTLTKTDGTTIKMGRFEALEYFQKIKQALGDEEYYRTLYSNEYEKSIHIPDADMNRIYAQLVEKFNGRNA